MFTPAFFSVEKTPMSKIVWKVNKKVRIYELAKLMGYSSEQTLYLVNSLYQWDNRPVLRSASSSLTLTEALSILSL